eukprot:GHVT01034536.1.p1 GENE.GHVT01034536.1~~GHVT01034536.1.p1  ORF type:complete len:443 (+),score=102.50 GHVT01034536.1:605-1933(+)
MSDGAAAQSLRLLKLLKLIRLVRLVRLARAMVRLRHGFRVKTSFASILQYFTVAALGVHLLSCGFHLLGVLGLQRKVAAAQPSASSPSSWLEKVGPDGNALACAGPGERYLAALYYSFSLVSTVGYGDVQPESHYERIFGLFAMAFGAWTFTYGVTNVMSMVKELNAKPLRFKRKVDSLSAFMTGHELPDALRARVREYFLLLRRHRIGTEELADEAWVFQELPAHLQIAIAVHCNAAIIRRSSLFSDAPQDFVEATSLKIKKIIYRPGDVIIHQGAFGSSMFLVASGRVAVEAEGIRITTLADGSVFGEMALLGVSGRRTATVKALTFCDVRLLRRASFLRVLRAFPGQKIILQAEARRRFRRTEEIKNIKRGKAKSADGQGGSSTWGDAAEAFGIPTEEELAKHVMVVGASQLLHLHRKVTEELRARAFDKRVNFNRPKQ